MLGVNTDSRGKTGIQMNVIPSNKIIKKSEIPTQYHRILDESAGHCRSKRESACVRKLLEAVKLSSSTRLEVRVQEGADEGLIALPSHAALKRLYADSPRGLASHSLSDHESQQSQSLQSETNSNVPIKHDKFVEMLRNKVENVDELIISEGLDPSTLNQFEEKLEGETHELVEEECAIIDDKEIEEISPDTSTEHIGLPVRPVHPLFSPNALELGRVTLKKVKWEDTSAPKLKSSLAPSSESEEILVNGLRARLNTWLESHTLPLIPSAVKAGDLHEYLGIGRFAKVVVADLTTKEEPIKSKAVALKIFTFSNTPEDITLEVEKVPRGVLLSWEREMKALVALSKFDHALYSDKLVKVLGGCLKPRPMIALELSKGNLTQFINHDGESPEGQSMTILKPNQRLKLAHDCCRGLAAMHLTGWCHLDIKPHNIMIFACPKSEEGGDDSGVVAKLGDFGSSFHFKSLGNDMEREVSEKVANSELGPCRKECEENAWALLRSGVGTSGWTSPELLEAVDSANDDIIAIPVNDEEMLHPSLQALHWSSDCFSFGILLWYCLFQDVADVLLNDTNQRKSNTNPFIGMNSSECKSALKSGVKLPWPHYDSHCQDNLSSISQVGYILERCCSLDANSRLMMKKADTEIEEILNDQDSVWF